MLKSDSAPFVKNVLRSRSVATGRMSSSRSITRPTVSGTLRSSSTLQSESNFTYSFNHNKLTILLAQKRWLIKLHVSQHTVIAERHVSLAITQGTTFIVRTEMTSWHISLNLPGCIQWSNEYNTVLTKPNVYQLKSSKCFYHHPVTTD